MQFSIFANSISVLTKLNCTCPKGLSVTKALCRMQAKPLWNMTQLREVSKIRKGFESIPKDLKDEEEKAHNKVHGVGKYTVFRDDDADIILDVDEERALKARGFNPEKVKIKVDEFAGINLERGIDGIYDLEDLVQVLQMNNAESIFVASLPEELQYANYIVIASGKSKRHMDSLATFVRRVYKKKCESEGPIPHIEGTTSNDWLALDLGNIILHIMSPKARKFYDLECLWSVGPEHDSKINDPDDPLVALLEEHTISLSDFHPVKSNQPSEGQGNSQPLR